MLDLQARIHLEEPERVLGQRAGAIDNEFYRPCPFIADRLGELHGRAGHRLAHVFRHAGGGRFLDHFLAAALQRAVALIEVDRAAMAVAEDLHLDMAGLLDELFQHDAAIAKGGLCLAHGAFELAGEIRLPGDKSDTPAPAARDGLDQDRIANLVGFLFERLCVLRLAAIAGQHGDARLFCDTFGFVLETHLADGLRFRADPDQASFFDGVSKVCILREETIARMDRLRA